MDTSPVVSGFGGHWSGNIIAGRAYPPPFQAISQCGGADQVNMKTVDKQMVDGQTNKRDHKVIWTHKGRALLERVGGYKHYNLPAGSISREELAALKAFIEDVELEEDCMREELDKPCGIDENPGLVKRALNILK